MNNFLYKYNHNKYLLITTVIIELCIKWALGRDKKLKLFHYSIYFWYYLWASLYFLALFMSFTILFQLIFTFIYSIFNNNFSVLTK